MLVRLGDYVVDTKNKESLLKIAREYLNRYVSYELLDTEGGVYESDLPNAIELVRGTPKGVLIRRSGSINLKHSGVSTPYGYCCDRELSWYKIAALLYRTFEELEKECAMYDILRDCGLSESDLSSVGIVLKKPVVEVDEKKVEAARNALKQLGVDYELTDDELEFLYVDVFHKYLKHECNCDFSRYKFALIDNGELENAKQKYLYMKNRFPGLREQVVSDAKKRYESV